MTYDIDIRDINLWRAERTPVVLVLYDATLRRSYWLDIQRFLADDPLRSSTGNMKTVRIHIPEKQRWNRRVIAALRQRKLACYESVTRPNDGNN